MRKKIGALIGASIAMLSLAVLPTVSASNPSLAKAEAVATETSETPAAKHEKMDLGNFYAFWTNWEGIEDETLSSTSKETYKVTDRRWNGLPTLCYTGGGRLWAGFMTGGYGEPDPLNYNAFHYSDDGGVTWSEEALVIEHKNETQHLYQPHLFMVDGVMHLWLNQGGQNAIEIANPDCEDPSENLTLTKATKVLNRNAAHRPTILSDKWDNIWMFSAENSTESSNAIWASTNGKKWEQYSSVLSTNGNRKWWEAQIVELADGTLLHHSRLEEGGDGGIELAWSYDGGETWTEKQANNGRPFLSYSNKAHMQLLDSGNLLFVVACSDGARENLTAFLSEDNGKTWPYSLSLDARKPNEWFGCGYPEAANLQGPNGEIYVVWDSRFSYTEIGCAKFTEADIKAGKIVTEGCYTYDNVFRNANSSGVTYKDISGVNETYDREITVKVGTTERDVNAQLPAKLTATYGEGESVTMTGMWICPDYDPEVAGHYTFRFDTPDMPAGYGDSYGHLLVRVTVGEEKKSGCNASLIGVAPVTAIMASIALAMKNKKKK